MKTQTTPVLHSAALQSYYDDSFQTSDRTSYAANVPISTLLSIPQTTKNREFKSRVHKQSKNFQKKAESVREITIFDVQEDIVVDSIHGSYTVPKGFSIGDGNTRLEWLRQLKESIDAFFSTATVKFVKIYNAEQYELEYDSYDSKSATETSPHILTGAIRAFGIDMRTAKAKKGQFGESIRYAYPGDRSHQTFAKVKYFHKELETADKYVFHVDDKKLRESTSALICAFLIAQKLYAEPSTQYQQLVSMMKKLSSITKDNWQKLQHPANDDDSRFDGAQLIMRESILREFTQKGTAGADYVVTLDFYLYCIEQWMKNKFLKNVSPTYFTGKSKEAKETLALDMGDE